MCFGLLMYSKTDNAMSSSEPPTNDYLSCNVVVKTEFVAFIFRWVISAQKLHRFRFWKWFNNQTHRPELFAFFEIDWLINGMTFETVPASERFLISEQQMCWQMMNEPRYDGKCRLMAQRVENKTIRSGHFEGAVWRPRHPPHPPPDECAHVIVHSSGMMMQLTDVCWRVEQNKMIEWFFSNGCPIVRKLQLLFDAKLRFECNYLRKWYWMGVAKRMSERAILLLFFFLFRFVVFACCGFCFVFLFLFFFVAIEWQWSGFLLFDILIDSIWVEMKWIHDMVAFRNAIKLAEFNAFTLAEWSTTQQIQQQRNSNERNG